MKAADIDKSKFYRLTGGFKVKVLEAPVAASRYSNRRDGARVEFLTGRNEGNSRTVKLHDIDREWTEGDDATLAQRQEREAHIIRVNERLELAGYFGIIAYDSSAGMILRVRDDEVATVLLSLDISPD